MGTWFKKRSIKKYTLSHDNESMDHILEGLLESQQPDGIKSALIGRICNEGAKSSQPAATVKGVLQVSCKWILHGSTELQVSSGFKLFHEWGKHNPEVFDSFFGPDSVAQMLLGGQGMDANVPLLIREGFRVLSLRGPSTYDDHAMKVQEGVTNFIHRTGHQRIVLRNSVLLFGEFNECIPASGDGVNQLCKVILVSLSQGALPQNGKEMVRYIKQTEEISNFLSKLWKLQYQQHLLHECLTEIFRIISSRPLSLDDDDCVPTIGLASVVKHIDPNLANQIVRDVVSDLSVPDQAIELAIGHLMDWLKWPTAVNVSQWLSCFLTELAASGKYTLMIRLTNSHVDQVMDNMAYPQLRLPSFHILSQLVMSFQHSPGPFHKILEKFPAIWKALRDENSLESHSWSSKMATLIYCLMYHHTGFPDLYDPILELIKAYPKPKDEEIKTELKTAQWSAQVSSASTSSSSSRLHQTTTKNNSTNYQACMSMTSTAANTSAATAFVSPLRLEKLESGKTGLDNLGNTCFMNSIIQALYMCDEFRREVLSKPPTLEESLLVKLQYIFASLSLSNRPSISPNKFMAASRPPWFEPGHQQDCSEFLKYLMDQLHENDKLGQMKKSYSSNSISSHNSLRLGHGGIPDTDDGCLLTSVKMKLHDESCANSSSDSAYSSDKETAENRPSSFVEKILRGKVETSLQCLVCKTQSKRIETFSDIPLAFPNGSSSSSSKSPIKATHQQPTLAGGSGNPSPVSENGVSKDSSLSSNETATATTTTANANSKCSETEENKCSNKNSNSYSGLSLNDLIEYYLKPERLIGDNQYHCDTCGKLQDGEKKIHIIESPSYLILTLLRFSYDTKQQTRTKIFQEVHYPRTLSIPVTGGQSSTSLRPGYSRECSVSSSSQHSRSNSLTNVISLKNPRHEEKAEKVLAMANAKHQEKMKTLTNRCDLYGLSSVVVHSGNSSDCGHYYCYARHSHMGQPNISQMEKIDLEGERSKVSLDDLDLLPDQWYNFNDSRITKTSYESFSNLTKRFSTDTAYVLIYRKLDLLGHSVSPDSTLRADLRDAITKDNEKYLHEQELEAKSREEQQRRRSASVSSDSLKNWKNDKDDDDMAGGGGGHCGGGGSMGGMDSMGPRFVF